MQAEEQDQLSAVPHTTLEPPSLLNESVIL